MSTKVCALPTCGRSNTKLKKCSICFKVAYCNKTCQKAHWKIHKKACQQISMISQKGCRVRSQPRSYDVVKAIKAGGDPWYLCPWAARRELEKGTPLLQCSNKESSEKIIRIIVDYLMEYSEAEFQEQMSGIYTIRETCTLCKQKDRHFRPQCDHFFCDECALFFEHRFPDDRDCAACRLGPQFARAKPMLMNMKMEFQQIVDNMPADPFLNQLSGGTGYQLEQEELQFIHRLNPNYKRKAILPPHLAILPDGRRIDDVNPAMAEQLRSQMYVRP